MMGNGWYSTNMMGSLGFFGPWLQNNYFWFAPLIILDLVLKGFALWRAGRNNQPYWFIALLIINSLGILPAIYLLFFQKRNGQAAMVK